MKVIITKLASSVRPKNIQQSRNRVCWACPAGRCGIRRAPVAALTIGGTTGISQPPNAESSRTSWLVNALQGTSTEVTRPRMVPSVHSTASTTRAGPAPMTCSPTNRVPAPTVINPIAGAP